MWLAQQKSGTAFSQRGYQWKQLFLPEGASLRMTYKAMTFYAKVVGEELIFRGKPVSPSQMSSIIAGDGRNAWRDLWVLLPAERNWASAARLRAQMNKRLEKQPLLPAGRLLKSDEWPPNCFWYAKFPYIVSL